MKQTPIEFINKFKFANKQNVLENTFTNGYCYYFAIILKTRFPSGKILFDKDFNHFVFQYDNKLYDITGNVTKKYMNLTDSWNKTIELQCLHINKKEE